MDRLVKKALELRREMLHEERDRINASSKLKDEAILIAARNKVSKRYKEIAKELGVEVIFNSGGFQTTKINRLKKEGKKFITIDSKLISKERDILGGF
jgi:proteasome assembly chaperone (PAC2) family protein